MTDAYITYAVADAVATITLNRPDKLNSFIGAMHDELLAALARVQSDPQVRALVLCGAGKAFCAGQDLSDPDMAIGPLAPDIGDVVERHYKPLVLALQNLRVPSIAQVQGAAAGAGCSLALACDLVVAGRSAYFLQAFSKIGLIPDTGGTWFLPQRLGLARALGLAMLADKLSAEQAAQWGLIWQVVDDAELAGRVAELAQRLAAMPTRALVATRALMHAAPNHTLEQQLSLEAQHMRELGWRPDFQEGVAAFQQKRTPRFTDR